MATQDACPFVTGDAARRVRSRRHPNGIVRRLAKLLLSLAYFGLRQALRATAWLLPRRRRPELVVLTYHQVRQSQAADFERQLDAIAAAGGTVFPDFAPPVGAKGRFVALTFDDGFEEAFRVAGPILKRRGICSTWFLATGFMGEPAGWIREPSHPNFGARLVPVAALHDLDASLFKLGTHTITHRRLSRLSPDEADLEVTQSRRDLEAALGMTVDLLAFPYGAYGQETLSRCQARRYRSVFGNLPVWRLASGGGFLRGRVSVEPTDWPLEFWLKLRGGYNWLAAIHCLRTVLPEALHGGRMGGVLRESA